MVVDYDLLKGRPLAVISKEFHLFHGYKIYPCSKVIGKNGKELKTSLRKRNGGKFDKRVSLYINGKNRFFTLHRLVAQCFLGPVYGLEVNHKDRDTLNCHIENLEITTRSANQIHWREDQKRKREVI